MQVAQLEHVSMTYGAVNALREVTFGMAEGETIALVGPNGAGKTTAIGLMTGLRRPQKGRVLLFGRDPRAPAARIAIGVTPQESAFPLAIRVGEVLDFARRHYPDAPPRAEIVEAFALGAHLNRPAAQMSGGQQRKLAVALAFCGGPKAVFLDEPTTGLDFDTRKQVWHYIARFKQAGGAVFLTTHYLEEAEALADRIVLLNNGVVLRSDSVAEIKSAVDVKIIRFTAEVAPVLASARLKSSEGARHTYLSADADGAVRELVEHGVAFSSLEVIAASLDQAVSEVLRSAS